MATYKALLTTAGAAKIAAATAGGTQVKITRMAVGDGGGKLPTPDPKQTKLVNEVYRANLNRLSIDAKNSNYLVAELVIQPDVGGFWMREMGLYDADGVLVAVSNMAESYKPKLAEGSGRLQTLRMVLIVSEIESIALSIDGSTVMATKDYVDDKLFEHEKSRNHPDGTLTAKGFVQLSSVVSSESEMLAATSKAVKAANDNANGRLPSGGTAVAANKLATSRKIAGMAFDGTADINLTPDNVGALPSGGTAVAANKLATPRKIAGVAFDGTADINLTPDNVGALPSGGTAVAATKLAMSRKIAGVAFDGTDDINLTPDNVGALPADETAVAATKLATSRKISGVAFDGTQDIEITAADVGAYPIQGGKVKGLVEADGFSAHGKPVVLPKEGGIYIGYNESAGYGETDFVNNSGNANNPGNQMGGFIFRNVSTPLGVEVSRVTISGNGDVNTSGVFKENGQRLFSPSNTPPYPVTSVNGQTGAARTSLASLDYRGWFKDEYTGKLEQWGTWTRTADTTWIVFPVAFAVGSFNIQLTLISDTSGGSGSNISVLDGSMNSTSFAIFARAGESGGFWRAVGK
ncbi:phage tail protein [Rahnella aquatilis]|uniref:Phage-related tail fiber protein n=1 Tax=Rahnella aquatilis (strain ATCC 33071 / DSM 4594 / JCM 1683 / NBRC 105701 / NCIMB 13365 / CIP 78.65) TaxID=745277 RepID=H2IRJ0_RAHAC|nr:phage tail protein [Rahnella aquatilis]AEX51426.1 phage-related tail fiber protein [Rahnella aquatilis CIP 78.65 = ATCC 33071]